MHELAPRIVTILQKYMRDTAVRVESSTTTRELQIDPLDIPLIVLDVEDAFDIHIGYLDEIELSATVGGLVAHVASLLETKALRGRPRPSVPRTKGTWISTGGERRR